MNNPLKFSVLDLVPRFGESTFEEALLHAVDLAQHAEAWGYRRYWAAEHHDLEHLSCASPEILLSHIGARTERIRLGSGAVLLPHYSPLKVAENFRMLAALYPDASISGSGGRREVPRIQAWRLAEISWATWQICLIGFGP